MRRRWTLSSTVPEGISGEPEPLYRIERKFLPKSC